MLLLLLLLLRTGFVRLVEKTNNAIMKAEMAETTSPLRQEEDTLKEAVLRRRRRRLSILKCGSCEDGGDDVLLSSKSLFGCSRRAL